MENILYQIKTQKLLKPGMVVGVATSGGSDSMALLHYLHSHQAELDIEVCAIHVDHALREKSADDAQFVMDWCKSHGIRAYKFRIDVARLAEQKKMTLEEAAREARFGVFETLFKKNVVDKIAIAHNMRDQAETILLNLFRGAGLNGASGMAVDRDGLYIRPMLDTTKKAILDYIFVNDIPYITDETNQDNSFSRNYIRNLILPLIEEKWLGATEKIVAFGKSCAQDDEFIQSQVFDDAVIYNEKAASIPCSYFLYPDSIVSRMLFKVFAKIGVGKDIERVHIEMLKALATRGGNGKKIKLPMKVTAFKEYDFITITNKHREKVELNQPFKVGTFDVPNFGSVTVKRTKNKTLGKSELILDESKIPADAVWRFREYGDMFEKFGGGTKKLKDYLIDKKIPARLRFSIPVLASGKQILAIAGIEIANSVRADDNADRVIKIITK